MLFFLLMLNLMFSMIFLFMIHPLSMGLMLLMQTLMISLISGTLNFNYWFSYILFIIMIGGMLVLFIYMTSIASNEKFKINNKLTLMIMFFIVISSIIYLLMDNYFTNINNYNYKIYLNSNYLMMSKFYNFPSNMIMYLLIIYLFITLIAVVKITSISLGPLRQKF
uniref:NADH-ubiquinone oxidoreductase chain 6 n=1 Tax=Aulacochthebius sp. IBE<ESP> RA1155 TaxID=2769893 RepID=A0A7H0DL06_9COLE|nr:NADH dehydrogenase subunit 6 [Aulacochthebius sp. IBE<ESP> RA1155]